MISATEKHLYGTEKQLQETQTRTKQLKQMNDSLEHTVQNIPAKITKEVKTRRKSGWWFWRRETETTENVQVYNSPFKHLIDFTTFRITRLLIPTELAIKITTRA